jgi:hypothetical protein
MSLSRRGAACSGGAADDDDIGASRSSGRRLPPAPTPAPAPAPTAQCDDTSVRTSDTGRGQAESEL